MLSPYQMSTQVKHIINRSMGLYPIGAVNLTH